MTTTMGEYLVGAYLRHFEQCDIVNYNVRPKAAGMAGMAEFDVVGLRFEDATAFVCEVLTHLDGINYGGNEKTIQVINEKLQRQQDYATHELSKTFPRHRFMLWAPIIPSGYLAEQLSQIPDLKVIANEDYTRRVLMLAEAARKTTRRTGNPFFRTLQLFTHLRGVDAQEILKALTQSHDQVSPTVG